MEEKKSLACKALGCECGHKKLLCWLIGLIVLVIVFCAGFRLGRWTTYFESYEGYGYSPSTMMRWGNQGYGGYGMMRGWRYYENTAVPTASTDTQPTTTPAEK